MKILRKFSCYHWKPQQCGPVKLVPPGGDEGERDAGTERAGTGGGRERERKVMTE